MEPHRSLAMPAIAASSLRCVASSAWTTPGTFTNSACASPSCAHVIARPRSARKPTWVLPLPCRARPFASAVTPPRSRTRVRCASPLLASAQRKSHAPSAMRGSPSSHRFVAKAIAPSFRMSSGTPCSDAARMRMHSSEFSVSEPMPLTPPLLVSGLPPPSWSAAAGSLGVSSSSSAMEAATSLSTTPLFTRFLSAPGTVASSAAIAAVALSFVTRPNPSPVRSTSSISVRVAPRKSLGTGTCVARVANAAQH